LDLKPRIVLIGVLFILVGVYLGIVNPTVTEHVALALGFYTITYHNDTVQPQILLRVNATGQIVPLNLTRTVLDGENIHGRYVSDEKLNFFLMNKESLQAWKANQSQIGVYLYAVAQSNYNFTTQINQSGEYYAVFANLPSHQSTTVVFEVDQRRALTLVSPEMELLPWIIIILGFIVFFIGLRIGSKKKTKKAEA
jgi:hypothetical protein